jgi:thioesterase domain-containing protein
MTQDARQFAIQSHAEQRYGDQPYAVHLAHVVRLLKESEFADRVDFEAAAWLHDVIEDTSVQADEIAKRFGPDVADIVSRVSDEPASTRAERKLRTYPKIKGHLGATVVKLCDRLANLEASFQNQSKLELYLAEHESFYAGLHFEGLATSLWDRLRRTVEAGQMQALLMREIPISQATGFRVREVTKQRTSIWFPLAPNRNHFGSAFGGSLQTAMVLSSYALFHRLMDGLELSAQIVLSHAEVEFTRPVSGDFIALCESPDSGSMAKFLTTLSRRGKARLKLKSHVIQVGAESEAPLAFTLADFAAIKPV